MAEPVSAPLTTRFGCLDALRGSALCGMVAYHTDWDLAALGWPVTNPAGSPAWTAFGNLVAAIFLAVSGAALVLARSKGSAAALRRLVVVGLAGAAVTAFSLWFAPDEPILFGILQCLAVSNSVVLAILHWPAFMRLGIAAMVILLPALWRSVAFDGWPLATFGLGTRSPPTLDFRPLLPWIGAVLVGTVVGEALLRSPARSGRGSLSLVGLRWLGRNSLAVYLLHQPFLYGALILIGLAVGAPERDADPFTLQCRSDCSATGAAARLCKAACACTAERLAGEAASASARGSGLTSGHLDALGAACRKAGGG
ncbi:MAG: DUF1624 domain-containing protein [Janthinobacterium lividum]